MGLKLLYGKDNMRHRRQEETVVHKCEKCAGEFDTNHGLESRNQFCK